MKKFIVCMSIAAALLSGTAAFAADASYDADNNAVGGITGDTYKTVLITKDGVTTDDGIVYVGQTESGTFAASTQFLLKENPADGYYTVFLGGSESGTPATMSFYIGEIPVTPTEIEADQAFTEEGTSADYTNVAFGWEGVDGSSAKTVILQLGDKAYGWDFPTTITGGDVNVGIKITDVPVEQYSENAKAYLSSKQLSDIKKPASSEENTVSFEDGGE